MCNFKYLLTFLIICLLGEILPAQIKGKITLLPDNKTYQVSVIPSFNLSPPLSTTNNGAITLVASVGGLDIVNLKAITGGWNENSFVESPAENLSFSYYFISTTKIEGLNYRTGQEIILFTFENAAECLAEVSIMDNDSDPFFPPNMLNVNSGNLFSILGLGPVNAYEGNLQQDAPCPSDLNISIEVENSELLCHDDKTSILIDLFGGESPFVVRWTNTATGATDSTISNQTDVTITIEDVPAGNYDIEIFDNRGKGTEVNQSIFAPEPIKLELVGTNVNCLESKDGQVEVTEVSGGTGTYSYEWNTGIINSSLINKLSEGTYEVTVTDENNCTAVANTFLKIAGWIELEADPTNISCFGKGDGTLSMSTTGKNPPFSYKWESTGQTGTTANLTNLQAGTYNLTVTDATKICKQTKVISIAEPAEVSVDALLDKFSICDLQLEGTLVVNKVQNNRGKVKYSLDGINFGDENQFKVKAGESYTVIVQDEAECQAEKDITVPSPSGLEVTLPKKFTLQLGDELNIPVEYFATTNVTFEWSPAIGLSCKDCSAPIVTPTRTTTYTLKVSDDNGCVKEASVIVYLNTTRRVYSPNAFSPNADNRNDRFTLYTGPDVASVKNLQIFDRWGERVYISLADYQPNDEYAHGWDGMFNGKQMLPGVYVYTAEIEFIDGKIEVFKGEVNLVR